MFRYDTETYLKTTKFLCKYQATEYIILVQFRRV